jgi:hypothetical protein
VVPAAWRPIRKHMSFDGSGTAQIKLGSTTSGTLYRS